MADGEELDLSTLSDEELVAGLRSATMAAKIFPLLCTSATLNIGVPQLLDAVTAYLPSPADRPFKGVDKSGAEVSRAAASLSVLCIASRPSVACASAELRSSASAFRAYSRARAK